MWEKKTLPLEDSSSGLRLSSRQPFCHLVKDQISPLPWPPARRYYNPKLQRGRSSWLEGSRSPWISPFQHSWLCHHNLVRCFEELNPQSLPCCLQRGHFAG